MMFDGGGDDVPALGLQEAGGAEDGQVGALGAAAGEDDFAGFGAQNLRRAVARVIQESPGLAADVMHAGRIAPDLAQERQHRLPDLRVQGRSGVVIEIDRLHGAGSSVLARHQTTSPVLPLQIGCQSAVRRCRAQH